MNSSINVNTYGSMGVRSRLSATLNEGDGRHPEVRARIAALTMQERTIADSYRPYDNDPAVDSDPAPGRIVNRKEVFYTTDVSGTFTTEITYDPASGAPLCMTSSNNKGTVQTDVRWDHEGNLAALTELRSYSAGPTMQTERIQLRHSPATGAIFYEESVL